jgi:IS605 OrfB family transposase
MKVTRISYSKLLPKEDYEQVKELARRLGILRSEVWNEYGSLKGVGVQERDIRNSWIKNGKSFSVPARWKETLRDTIDGIQCYREAAKVQVRKAVFRRKGDEDTKPLYVSLKSDTWTSDPFLRRQMRKHFKHGHTSVRNQIVLDMGCYTAEVIDGKACVSMTGLVPRKRIRIPLTTDRVPTGTLRLILNDGRVAVHYCVEAEGNCVTRPCGDKTLGVDKGYTEAFTDSDGDRHGRSLGPTLSAESDRLKVKHQRRNKLQAIAELKPRKRDKILKNNLGGKKFDARKSVHTSHVRDVAFKAVHSVLDKASVVIAEDLKAPIKSKRKQSRDGKRRLSAWVKGTLAVALSSAAQRRGAEIVLVNAAYTSQMDSFDGTLTGTRKGDSFYRINGDVVDADWNAARNILARKEDREIGLFTPFREVKAILLKRNELRLGLLNQDSSRAPSGRQRRAKC